MENVERLADLLRDIGADWAVLTSADAVCFATGHIVPIEIGQSPFSGGPTVAFVGRDASVGLVCPNTDSGQSGAWHEISYAGFACAVTDQVANFADAVRKMIRRLGVSGKVAIEPHSFTTLLSELLPGDNMAIDVPLARLRSIKTDREIKLLRRAAEIAALGQEEARRASMPGRRELEILGNIRARMETAAGTRCALAGEYLSGTERTATLGLQPNDRVLKEGDPVICDLAPRVSGYWGDSCGSFLIGQDIPAQYVEMYNACRETLELASSELKPGLRACDFDRLLRNHLAGKGYSYPHHSGHGIGASVHEFPRLVPNETALIEENMMLMVEPGSYIKGLGGIRCEFMFRVTRTGAQAMAKF